MVVFLLADGFETAEALVPVDLLRRAGVEVVLAGVGGTEILSGQKVAVRADCGIDELDASLPEMVVLPGGGQGYEILRGSEPVRALVLDMAARGKLVAAICASPVLLGELGLLKGRRAVCFPSMSEELVGHGAMLQSGECVVQDSNIITARAAGSSFEFGLQLISALLGRGKAEEVRRSVYYPDVMPAQ